MQIKKDASGVEWEVFAPRYFPFLIGSIAVSVGAYLCCALLPTGGSLGNFLGIVGLLGIMGCAAWLVSNAESQAAWLKFILIDRWSSSSGGARAVIKGWTLWTQER